VTGMDVCAVFVVTDFLGSGAFPGGNTEQSRANMSVEQLSV
jgi:hypothetical protein